MHVKDKKKLKREDFVFEDAWFETVTKKPAELQMQQFQVSDCQQCDIFLYDSNAGVYVDDCKYCTIFIGPSQSSIFIRNSHYLKIICLTKQFRVRDCTNCSIWLWCESQAVIESSHSITFTNFPQTLGYEEVAQQMKQAKLQLWNNNWFCIYDFTPMKFGGGNYQCVRKIEGQEEVFQKVRQSRKKFGVRDQRDIVPQCMGVLGDEEDTGGYDVVVITPVPETGLGVSLLHSRVGPFPEQMSPFVPEIAVGTSTLFIKIKPADKDKWRQLNKAGKRVEIVCSPKANQILQQKIFTAFQDQR